MDSSYLGATETDEGCALALDDELNAFVTGRTNSASGFPSPGPDPIYGYGDFDAFVMWVDPNGALTAFKYLGGSSVDEGFGIALDRERNVVVTGRTNSESGFPTGTALIYGYGGFDAFAVKLDPEGALQYTARLGGAETDEGADLVLDSAGNAYVTGRTNSASGFPSGTYPAYSNGDFDAFLARLDPTGQVAYSAYIGATETDEGRGIDLDRLGRLYITGRTNSASGFPSNRPSPIYGYGGFDAFVTKLDARQPRPVGSTVAQEMKASDATLVLDDISRFPERGEIQVDGERMTYDGKQAALPAGGGNGSGVAPDPIPGALLNLQRGVAGTTPAAHQVGAVVALLTQVAVGDCNADQAVMVDELITGVNIALGNLLSTACPSFDADANGSVTVDELIWAVSNALNGV